MWLLTARSIIVCFMQRIGLECQNALLIAIEFHLIHLKTWLIRRKYHHIWLWASLHAICHSLIFFFFSLKFVGGVRCLLILNAVFAVVFGLLALFLGSTLLTLGSSCSMPLFIKNYHIQFILIPLGNHSRRILRGWVFSCRDKCPNITFLFNCRLLFYLIFA